MICRKLLGRHATSSPASSRASDAHTSCTARQAGRYLTGRRRGRPLVALNRSGRGCGAGLTRQPQSGSHLCLASVPQAARACRVWADRPGLSQGSALSVLAGGPCGPGRTASSWALAASTLLVDMQRFSRKQVASHALVFVRSGGSSSLQVRR